MEPETSSLDIEKSVASIARAADDDSDDKNRSLPTPAPVGRLTRLNNKIESLAGLEARGITRVLPDERHATSLAGYVQMGLLWFSANVTANNLAVGFLGPLVFDLGFVDSSLCAVFGAFVGCLATSYMGIWGAQSGNRTMVCCYPIRRLPVHRFFIVHLRFNTGGYYVERNVIRRLWLDILWDIGHPKSPAF